MKSGGLKTAVRVSALLLMAAGIPSSRAAEPDAARGQKIFETCAACHAPDQPAKIGPDLRGVVGRKAGAVPGFRYSRAVKTANLVWNDVALDSFLSDPQVLLPGNTMPYPGIPDAAQRRDLIAYLKTLK